MMLLRTNGLITLTTVALALTGCAGVQKQPQQPQQPQMTPLEIQNMQTREYKAPAKIVFASVISVLHNVGFTIKSADSNIGLIYAESAIQQAAVPQMSFMKQTTATAFVEEISDRTHVRLNFVEMSQSSVGSFRGSRRDAILDAKIYTNAFERIENAIFIRSGN